MPKIIYFFPANLKKILGFTSKGYPNQVFFFIWPYCILGNEVSYILNKKVKEIVFEGLWQKIWHI